MGGGDLYRHHGGCGRGDRRSRSRSGNFSRARPASARCDARPIYRHARRLRRLPHQAGRQDARRWASLKTPLGTIYTTNITPDRDTGIGNYTFADFARAMRLGVRPDGAPLYPAMPYTAYAKMSDEDLQDLFGYLQKTIAPVSQTPPANTVGWPLNMRWPLAFWNVAFLDASPLSQQSAKEPQSWNRGAYLVEALEHCGECHTPRGVAQNSTAGENFGAVLQGWKAYNITSSKQSGVGAGATQRSRPTEHRARRRPLLRRAARWPKRSTTACVMRRPTTFTPSSLTCAASRRSTTRPPSRETRRPQPKATFTATKPAASRSSPAIPPIPHQRRAAPGIRPTPTCTAAAPSTTPTPPIPQAILLAGSNAPLPVERAFMPPFARGHSDDELAAVANFVNGFFGNGTTKVTAADIDKARKALPLSMIGKSLPSDLIEWVKPVLSKTVPATKAKKKTMIRLNLVGSSSSRAVLAQSCPPGR